MLPSTTQTAQHSLERTVIRVLIVGAGIAGDGLAVFLERIGWRVVITEIAPASTRAPATAFLQAPSAAAQRTRR